CEDVGTPVVVTLTVVDVNGNISTCASTVTIETDPPMASCQDITISLGPDGIVIIEPGDIAGESGSNCGAVELELSEDTFDCEDVGNPVVVTLTVTDAQGIETTCTATVTVIDDTDPICSAQDITVYV